MHQSSLFGVDEPDDGAPFEDIWGTKIFPNFTIIPPKNPLNKATGSSQRKKDPSKDQKSKVVKPTNPWKLPPSDPSAIQERKLSLEEIQRQEISKPTQTPVITMATVIQKGVMPKDREKEREKDREWERSAPLKGAQTQVCKKSFVRIQAEEKALRGLEEYYRTITEETGERYVINQILLNDYS